MPLFPASGQVSNPEALARVQFVFPPGELVELSYYLALLVLLHIAFSSFCAILSLLLFRRVFLRFESDLVRRRDA